MLEELKCHKVRTKLSEGGNFMVLGEVELEGTGELVHDRWSSSLLGVLWVVTLSSSSGCCGCKEKQNTYLPLVMVVAIIIVVVAGDGGVVTEA